MTTDSATIEALRLKEIFEERKAELRCPICGNDSMQAMDSAGEGQGSAVTKYRLAADGTPVEASAAIMTVAVACTNCGFVRQFVKKILLRERELNHGV
jgi:DNA-directed RNA polymerase subunit RPC12/RpoP